VSIRPYDRSYGRLLAPSLLALAVMWLVHTVIGAGWVVDLAATVVSGTVVYAAAYLAVGLTQAERRGAAALLQRVPVPGMSRVLGRQAR
jgi:hypothetical protein